MKFYPKKLITFSNVEETSIKVEHAYGLFDSSVPSLRM